MVNCHNCGRSSEISVLCDECNIKSLKHEIRKCDECEKWIDGNLQFCPDCQIAYQKRKLASKANPDYVTHDNSKDGTRSFSFKPRDIVSKVGQTATSGVQKAKDIANTVITTVKNIPEFEMGKKSLKSSEVTNDERENAYRNKYPRDFRTDDGHFVRSQGERTIDNWFYLNQIAHEYERCLTKPDGKWVFPDFVLPYDMEGEYFGSLSKGILVEYWGVENKADYEDRKKKKLEYYKLAGYQVIEIRPPDLKDINKLLRPKFADIFKEKFKK